MLKIKTPLKKLSVAVALGLLVGTASANTDISIYSTLQLAPEGAEPADGSDWAGGAFYVSSSDCPDGCSITSAELRLRSEVATAAVPAQLIGVSLNVHSTISNDRGYVPTFDNLMQLITPDSFQNTTNLGGFATFKASNSDPSPAILQPDAWYMLVLSSTDEQISWVFNGKENSGYWANAFWNDTGSPMIFEVRGMPLVPATIPVPGALWLMGSALIGLISFSRKKSGWTAQMSTIDN